MEQLEQNVIMSFQLAKKDIFALRSAVINLERDNFVLREKLKFLENSQKQLSEKLIALEVPKKEIVKPLKKKQFIASKTGKRFHLTSCPFAKNIKSKSKINFVSKISAFDEGYNACECVI